MLNVDSTGFVSLTVLRMTLRLFVTKMLVTMTPQFWQQTQNYTTKKLGENVAKSLY